MLLNIEKDRLTLDGEPFYLACGDIQYFRIHPTEWKPRLEKMKEAGFSRSRKRRTIRSAADFIRRHWRS